MDWSKAGDIIQGILLSAGGAFASVYASSKKFRGWINNKLKDTESIKDLNTKQKDLETKENNLENTCAIRTKEISDSLSTLNTLIADLNTKIGELDSKIEKLDTKMEKDNKSTLLTLKSQIIDICSRVSRYGGITQPDKELLCELYTEYVDVWKQNHYVKSEADRVIKTAQIIVDYKGQV